MNAKQKAQELVERFCLELKEHKGYYDFETAKQCAIICVDEIIKDYNYECPSTKYWQEVKLEIQNYEIN